MKKLVKIDRSLTWLPKPGEGRLYLTDELPPVEICFTCCFAFAGDHLLLTRLKDRDWDIPGGRIEPGETPEQDAIWETLEETFTRVAIIDLIGIQELELFGPRPANHRWGYPLTVQVYYRGKIVDLLPFECNAESHEREFFNPEEARLVKTMQNHADVFEEALRRARADLADNQGAVLS
jgi:ADP-ribose pyrophosphatase YjhB (NUDIX family)